MGIHLFGQPENVMKEFWHDNATSLGLMDDDEIKYVDARLSKTPQNEVVIKSC